MISERPFNRIDRVANEIQNILGLIQTQYIDLSNLGFITFTKVIVSSDLKHAKVFFGVVNEKMSIKNITIELNKKSKAFRKYLGQEMTTKFTPKLRFFYDDSLEYTKKLDQLFNNLKSEKD